LIKRWWPSLLVVLAAGGAGVAYGLTRPGELLINATDATGRELDRVTVYLDGLRRCETSPCMIETSPGRHILKALPEGLPGQNQEAIVHSGEVNPLVFRFVLAGSPISESARVAPATPMAALAVAPPARDLDLDRVGEPPMPAKESLAAPTTTRVNAPAPTATVPAPAAPSAAVPAQLADPVPAPVATPAPVAAAATAPSASGEAPRSDSADAARPRAPARAKTAPRVARGEAVAPAPTSHDEGGTCTLNVNSLPPAELSVDGQPVGYTPRFGITSSAGTHELVLNAGGDLKKTTRVKCRAGEAKNVAVRLDESQ
jgi:hypothetical protein